MAENKKVALVADDSTTTRQFVSMALSQLGFRVVVAEDGMEALELLPREEVKIIITDLNMPNIDGLNFIRQIRSHEKFKDVPIIVLSSIQDARIRQQCLEAGANAFLIKPFNHLKIQYEVVKLV